MERGKTYYKHIGLYAFTRETLKEVTALEQTPLEIAEQLEQLRWRNRDTRLKSPLQSINPTPSTLREDLEYSF